MGHEANDRSSRSHSILTLYIDTGVPTADPSVTGRCVGGYIHPFVCQCVCISPCGSVLVCASMYLHNRVWPGHLCALLCEICVNLHNYL